MFKFCERLRGETKTCQGWQVQRSDTLEVDQDQDQDQTPLMSFSIRTSLPTVINRKSDLTPQVTAWKVLVRIQVHMMSSSHWEYSPPKNLNFFLSHVAADKKCKWDQLSLSYVWSWQHCWPSCWHTWCPAMPNISQYDEKMFTPNVWHINITSLVPSFVRQKNNSAPILLYEDRL